VPRCLEQLTAGPFPLLYRYLNDDGVGGPEGAFLLPSFWLVEVLALAGDLRRARSALDRLVERTVPVRSRSRDRHAQYNTGQRWTINVYWTRA